ncbi:MAG: cobalamin-dependent protein [Pseudomonadota bacterium]
MSDSDEQKGEKLAVVADLLHRKIIPNLLLNTKKRKKFTPADFSVEVPDMPSQVDISHFVALLLAGDEESAAQFIDKQLKLGTSGVEVYLGLLTDSARMLGNMWSSDECSFGDVTLGLTTLHKFARRYDAILENTIQKLQSPGSVYIVVVPGQTHVFGAIMLDVFFSIAGWSTRLSFDETEKEITNTLAGEEIDLVCLSAARDEDVDVCKSLIKSFKQAAVSSDLKVMVGGRPFIQRRELFRRTGADGTAVDALHALDLASEICNLSESRESIQTSDNMS